MEKSQTFASYVYILVRVQSCRGKSAGVLERRVSDLPPEILTVTIRNFCIAVGRVGFKATAKTKGWCSLALTHHHGIPCDASHQTLAR
jgi:hypothetical protein